MSYALTPEQKAQFDDSGFLVLEDIFTNEELQVVIDAIAAELQRKVETAVKDGSLSRGYDEYDFETRLVKINDESTKIASSMWDQKVVLPEFFGLIANPKLVDIASQLCESDELIASSVYRLRPKVPRHHASAVPWHQDSGYFEPSCDKDLILTVWLPLVDANEENGCMWSIPNLHKSHTLLRHAPDKNKHYIEIVDPCVDDKSKWVCCPVKKGGALFLTNRTPHGSFENKTEKVRWSMDLRYQAATVPTNIREKHSTANLNLDIDGVPLSCNPPEPDFVVKSKLHPELVMKTGEEFVELRRNHTYKEATDRWGFSSATRVDVDGGGGNYDNIKGFKKD
jgi:ectoine hydroxylase-related dioxygenase (phytanoyl-CoA dioxygenase family)